MLAISDQLPPNTGPAGTVPVNGASNNTSNKNLSHVPCKFFRQGLCQAGNSCPFSHDLDGTLAADKLPCKYFQKGNCKFGPRCALAHILPDGTRVNSRTLRRADRHAAFGSLVMPSNGNMGLHGGNAGNGGGRVDTATGSLEKPKHRLAMPMDGTLEYLHVFAGHEHPNGVSSEQTAPDSSTPSEYATPWDAPTPSDYSVSDYSAELASSGLSDFSAAMDLSLLTPYSIAFPHVGPPETPNYGTAKRPASAADYSWIQPDASMRRNSSMPSSMRMPGNTGDVFGMSMRESSPMKRPSPVGSRKSTRSYSMPKLSEFYTNKPDLQSRIRKDFEMPGFDLLTEHDESLTGIPYLLGDVPDVFGNSMSEGFGVALLSLNHTHSMFFDHASDFDRPRVFDKSPGFDKTFESHKFEYSGPIKIAPFSEWLDTGTPLQLPLFLLNLAQTPETPVPLPPQNMGYVQQSRFHPAQPFGVVKPQHNLYSELAVEDDDDAMNNELLEDWVPASLGSHILTPQERKRRSSRSQSGTLTLRPTIEGAPSTTSLATVDGN